MSSLDKAVQTQLDNIARKTGQSLTALAALVRASGLTKHSELRAMVQKELGLGYGDANALVHYALASDGTRAAAAKGATPADVAAELYTGPKAALRPLHDKVMACIAKLGPAEIVPKKGYLSLRRKKQFAMVGPATKTQVEVGLNMKGARATSRLVAQPPGGMCTHKVRLAALDEVDAELTSWIKQAYEGAG